MEYLVQVPLYNKFGLKVLHLHDLVSLPPEGHMLHLGDCTFNPCDHTCVLEWPHPVEEYGL